MAHVAILATDEFEDVELERPLAELRAAGHDVTIVGPEVGATIRGKRRSCEVQVDRAVADVEAADFDALVIPGGSSPDKLRVVPEAVRFAHQAMLRPMTVATICHGPSLLVDTYVIAGRRLTSWPSIKVDLHNAGARWEDAEVVVDGDLITSRGPDDLTAFCEALLTSLGEPDVGER